MSRSTKTLIEGILRRRVSNMLSEMDQLKKLLPPDQLVICQECGCVVGSASPDKHDEEGD